MHRWIIPCALAFVLAAACDRAERDRGQYEVGAASNTTKTKAVEAGGEGGDGGGAGGSAGGDGGAVGQGGGPDPFCDQPGSSCEQCVQCQLQGNCGLQLNECETLAECANAVQCLQDCPTNCPNNTPSCLESCEMSCEQEQPGFFDALDVLDCFCRLGCPDACADTTLSGCAGLLP